MPQLPSKATNAKTNEDANKNAELPRYSEAARIATKDFAALDTCKDLGLDKDEFRRLKLPGVSASEKEALFEQMLRLTRTPEHSYGELSRADLGVLQVAPYLRKPTAHEVSMFYENNRETFDKIAANKTRREEIQEQLCNRARLDGAKLTHEIAELDKAYEKLASLLSAPYVALTGDIMGSVSGHEDTLKVQYRNLNSFGNKEGMRERGKGFRIGFNNDLSGFRSIIIKEDGTLLKVNYEHLLNQE